MIFLYLDLLNGLTLFADKKEEEYIDYLYLDNCLDLAYLYCHIQLRVSVLIVMILLHHFWNSQIAGTGATQAFIFI